MKCGDERTVEFGRGLGVGGRKGGVCPVGETEGGGEGERWGG